METGIIHYPKHGYFDVNKMHMPDQALKIGVSMVCLDWCLPKLLCPISVELTN